MPALTRWFIKLGMIYFLAGIILAFVSELPFLSAGPLLLPVYWHMLVIGWITQVIMGVSIWMFPRKRRDKPKRESTLGWFTFWLLNTGLILRFSVEPFLPILDSGRSVNAIIILSALLQVAAIICYILEIWPRVQPKKKRKRSTA